jgi:hypothetical protein
MWQYADTYIVEREDTHIAACGHGWHAAQRVCGHTYSRDDTHIGRQYATYVYTRVRMSTNIAVCGHGWHAAQRRECATSQYADTYIVERTPI